MTATSCRHRHCGRPIEQKTEPFSAGPTWYHVETSDTECRDDTGRYTLESAEPSNGPFRDYIVDEHRRAEGLRARWEESLQMRDEAIRDELKRGTAVATIAELTGMHVQRVYQIRDGRR